MADDKVQTGQANLATKLHKARAAANPVGKEGRNDQQKYDYVRAEDVIAEAQRVLDQVAVVVTPQILDVQLEEAGQTRGGTISRIATVLLEFDVTDAESGESMTRQWAGTGWDAPGDKALYKAVTGGTKYFLAHLIGIPFGADPDDDSGAQTTSSSKRRRTAKDKPVNPLDKARVQALGAKIGEQGLTYGQVDLALGAAGIDGLRAGSKQALKERLESLTTEQADALDKELGK